MDSKNLQINVNYWIKAGKEGPDFGTIFGSEENKDIPYHERYEISCMIREKEEIENYKNNLSTEKKMC